MASQPGQPNPPQRTTPQVNKGFIARLIKGNQWRYLKLEGFQITLFQAILGVEKFPLHKPENIHTAYITVGFPPFWVPEMFGGKAYTWISQEVSKWLVSGL